MDLGGIQGVFHDGHVYLVQAQSPVPDRLAGSTVPTASSTVPSAILVLPGSFGPYLTLRSKTAAKGDPLQPNYTLLILLDCVRSPINGIFTRKGCCNRVLIRWICVLYQHYQVSEMTDGFTI
jgi:hypothetical protein